MTIKTFVYLRISTRHLNQKTDSQMEAIRNYLKLNGVQDYEVFEDIGVSGLKTSRPAFESMINEIKKPGEKRVICYSISRLSRSIVDLAKLIEVLKEHNTSLVSISESIDLSTASGRAFLGVLSCLNQMEVELLRERVVAGLEAAKAKGVQLGRPRKYDRKMIRLLLEKNLPIEEVVELSGSSRSTVYRIRSELMSLRAA